ncbi:CRISPR-associated protein Cas5 family [Solidesulfovibrio fructosivorans JJ]]|uniref:CRISPR-associated protein Cas5 family n=1 Tax=Solidesulfovibrio fructosivorans JJ] TaxID=596151 RepID=E1JXX4_SOLFR|nr:type I-E CRISPR-associated protein Cas5/CasD [Solidesulfovibrio fructosivorans]EFL50712.1 CRISPR-associated protein Cas5 family [Solidesulfovibrio fructosivorans JJ]]
MTEFMVLRLTGPLMVFGDVAVDENRPTAQLPSQSMLTGLVANALGWRAREGARLNRLQERIVYGARRDRVGETFTDYQNVHIAPGQTMWRFRTTGPLKRGGLKYDNVQRWRDYVADGAVTVVLALTPEDEPPTLDAVRRAFLRPARPLFLGRVSCPPSGPLYRGKDVMASSVPEALALVSSLETPGGDFLAQWPGQGTFSGVTDTSSRLVERADLRDWCNDLHQGRRIVAEARLRPEPNRAEEG